MKSIRTIRKQIEHAINSIISRMGTYEGDCEAINEVAELNVDMEVMDDLFRVVKIVNVAIITDNERVYSNLEKMIRLRLEEAAEGINREAEADYVERLSSRQRRNYYADIA